MDTRTRRPERRLNSPIPTTPQPDSDPAVVARLERLFAKPEINWMIVYRDSDGEIKNAETTTPLGENGDGSTVELNCCDGDNPSDWNWAYADYSLQTAGKSFRFDGQGLRNFFTRPDIQVIRVTPPSAGD